MDAYKSGFEIIKLLKEEGYTAYFAGGWVRDFLMKHPSDDIDIATSAKVEDIERIFPHTIPVGIQFGIVIVVHGNHHFEVATFRKDMGYEDGRRPLGVESGSAFEDAQRRDFTVNGMFYDPTTDELFDFVEGKKDLDKKIIKAIGDPHHRFLEDRLRMIRAVRYATRFSFAIDHQTQEAIIAHASALFPAVAVERVWQEFAKMHKFNTLSMAIPYLHRVHLLSVIFPSLQSLPIQEIEKRAHIIALFPSQTPLVLAIFELFPEKDLQEKLLLTETFKLSKIDREWVIFYENLVTSLDKTGLHLNLIQDDLWVQFYADPKFLISFEIALVHFDKKTKEQLHHLHTKHQLELQPFIQYLEQKKPFLKAEDLFAEGIAAGKKMGELLALGNKIAINQKLLDPILIIQELKKTSLWDRLP